MRRGSLKRNDLVREERRLKLVVMNTTRVLVVCVPEFPACHVTFSDLSFCEIGIYKKKNKYAILKYKGCVYTMVSLSS